jgi:hypothetical protein
MPPLVMGTAPASAGRTPIATRNRAIHEA